MRLCNVSSEPVGVLVYMSHVLHLHRGIKFALNKNKSCLMVRELETNLCWMDELKYCNYWMVNGFFFSIYYNINLLKKCFFLLLLTTFFFLPLFHILFPQTFVNQPGWNYFNLTKDFKFNFWINNSIKYLKKLLFIMILSNLNWII